MKTVGLNIIMINSELRKKQKKQKGFTIEKYQKVGIAIKSMKESGKRIITQLKFGIEIFSQSEFKVIQLMYINI
ncbi:MAG TPA: hypothetical protein VLR29_01540 [Flavobacterium sp.]|nr:hypothetical protein [Flavobacterium sp.]